MTDTPPFQRRPIVWGKPAPTTFVAGPLPPVAAPPIAQDDSAGGPGPDTAARLVDLRASGGAAAGRRSHRIPDPSGGPSDFGAGAGRPVADKGRAAATRPIANCPVAEPRPLPPIVPDAAAEAPVRPPPARSVHEPLAPPVVPAPSAAAARSRGAWRRPAIAATAVVALAGLAFVGWRVAQGDGAPAPAPSTVAADSVPAAPTTSEAPQAMIIESPAAVAEPPSADAPEDRSAPTAPVIEPEPRQAAATPAPPPVVVPEARAEAVEPAPLIVLAPPAGPPPTPAEATPTDPDAPIATRPTPLG